MRNAINFFLLSILFAACGTSTSIQGSWKEENIQPQNYSKVAIMAIASEQGRRRAIERELADALQERGISATPSYLLFEDDYLKGKPSKAELQQKLEAAGIDGVLTVALLDTKEESHYVPGTTYAPSYPYYGGYYNYYYRWSPVMSDPGYYTQSTNYFLESNFFDVQQSKLIWSAQTKTVDPTSITNFAKSYSDRVVKQMRKDDVISS